MTRPAGETVEDRFWRKVRKAETNGCREWTGYKHWGYGVFWVNGKRIYAHRFSWELHKGPVPEGMRVLHSCDNASCIWPEHLFLGTQSDNANDMVAKGRHNPGRGERQASAKLTEAQVREIRDMSGTLREIASLFGVHHKTILMIKKGKQWKHI